jgi:hypothetical protein
MTSKLPTNQQLHIYRYAFAEITLEKPKAEFLDVIGTKVLRVFLLVFHSHLFYGLYPPPTPPTPPEAKVVLNWM